MGPGRLSKKNDISSSEKLSHNTDIRRDNLERKCRKSNSRDASSKKSYASSAEKRNGTEHVKNLDDSLESVDKFESKKKKKDASKESKIKKRKKIVDDDATLELDTTIDIESSV